MSRFPLFLFGGLLFAILAHQAFAVPAEVSAIRRTPPGLLVDVVDSGSLDVDVDELMGFLRIRSWKVRLESDEPFECFTPRLVHWERDENDAWVGTQLGATHTNCVGTSTRAEVTVFMREEGETVRIGRRMFTPDGADSTQPDWVTLSLDEARRYSSWLHGEGLLVDGHRILCAEIRGDVLYDSLDCMESFLALEVELERDGP